ncbi:MAG: 4Fe-4S binding protein [Planctomycetes bacterium]|nr:4Fe-4S binding protein [Planctomycetota bacterium]
MGRWRALVLIAVHVLVLVHVAHWKLGGKTLTPVEPSEAMQTFELGYVNAGFVLFAVAVLLTLVVGRFFCGWVCHLVAYQDLCAWLLGKVGLRPKPVRSRLLVWVPLGAALYMFVWPSFARWLAGHGAPEWTASFQTDDLWKTFPSPAIAALTIAVDGFLIVYLLGAKGFCTYGCPYGAVFGAVDRLAPGRIRVTDACSGCGQCTATCTSNVRVHEEVALYRQVVDPGCMKCLDCVSVCPEDALYFGFKAKSEKKPARAKAKRAYDFTWGEEFVAALAFVVALFALRGLYDAVPFLLAIGLSVIFAAVAVASAKFVRSRDFAFQTHVLRREGRTTRAGFVGLASVGALTALVAHSGFVQAQTSAGESALERASRVNGAERTALVDEAREHLETAATFGLAPYADLELQLGSIDREQGRLADARKRLARAHELAPSKTAATLALASIAIAERDLSSAKPLLEDVLAREPANAEARRWLERVDRELAGDANAPVSR